MIKIIKEEHELDEDHLNQLEAQGLILISVYHVVYHDRVLIDEGVGGSRPVDWPQWVYHFRCAAKKSSEPDPDDASVAVTAIDQSADPDSIRNYRFGPRD